MRSRNSVGKILVLDDQPQGVEIAGVQRLLQDEIGHLRMGLLFLHVFFLDRQGNLAKQLQGPGMRLAVRQYEDKAFQVFFLGKGQLLVQQVFQEFAARRSLGNLQDQGVFGYQGVTAAVFRPGSRD